MKNWKTTMAGILAVVGGGVRLYFAFNSEAGITEEAIISSATAILTGIGLMFSKDFNVTGGNIKQELPPKD